jgi:hypothetical protein
VALSTARLPIDFVRLIPYVGPELPENAPAADQGPPLASASSVSAIGRETMAAPPTAPTQIATTTTPRPRREPAAVQSPAAPPQAPTAVPPQPAPDTQPAPQAAPQE